MFNSKMENIASIINDEEEEVQHHNNKSGRVNEEVLKQLNKDGLF